LYSLLCAPVFKILEIFVFKQGRAFPRTHVPQNASIFSPRHASRCRPRRRSPAGLPAVSPCACTYRGVTVPRPISRQFLNHKPAGAPLFKVVVLLLVRARRTPALGSAAVRHWRSPDKLPRPASTVAPVGFPILSLTFPELLGPHVVLAGPWPRRSRRSSGRCRPLPPSPRADASLTPSLATNRPVVSPWPSSTRPLPSRWAPRRNLAGAAGGHAPRATLQAWEKF
jgi:hypothetical protein